MEYLDEKSDILQRTAELGKLIGNKISSLRREMRLTQEEFGEIIGVSAQAVSKWERGGTPDITMIPIIAQKFGISTDELFGLKNARDPFELSKDDFCKFVSDYVNRICHTKSEELEGEYDRNDEKFFDIMLKVMQTMHDGFTHDKNEAWDGSTLDEGAKKISLMRLLISEYGTSMIMDKGDIPLIVVTRDTDNLRDTLLGEELLKKFFADFSDPDFFRLAVYVQTHGRIYSQYTVDYIAKTMGFSQEKAKRYCELLETYGFWRDIETICNNEVTHSYAVRRNVYFRPILMLIYMMVRPTMRTCNTMEKRMKPML